MKYLIEIHHGIGDLVQMTGVLDIIHDNDPEAYVALIVNRNALKSLFEKDTRVDALYCINFCGMGWAERLENIWKIRKQHFDRYLISPISNVKASRVLAKLINAGLSAGEQLQNSLRQIHVEPDYRLHIVERNYKIASAIGLKTTSVVPTLRIKDVIIPINVPRKTVALSIGTSLDQKTWETEKYLDLANDVLERGYHVIVLGGEKENNLLNNYALKDDITNLCGKTSLIQTAKIASLCELVVGGDTGVMHIAAAVGTKTLTLFSCTNPLLHCPYSKVSYYYNENLPCQFCYENGKFNNYCMDYKCIKNIESQTIIRIVNDLLDGKEMNEYKYCIR